MKTKSLHICIAAIALLFSISVFSQTKGFIYKAALSSTARSVLDPNGDGYTSLTNTGFTGTDDYTSSASELATISLPVLYGETSGDLSTGASGGHTDLVSNTTSSTHSVSVLVKTVNNVQYLIVRFRIGNASTASKGYSLLIDSDNDFGTYLTSNNPGYDREIIMETGNPGHVKVYKHDATGKTTLADYNADSMSQRSFALSTNNSDADYFYDFCVPLSDIQATNAVRITAATITSAQSGITGTVSDFNGYGTFTNPYQVMKDITNSFPSNVKLTDLVAGFTFGSLITAPPVITSTINANSSSISGTSTEQNGTVIYLYKQNVGAYFGTTTVSSNGWTYSGAMTLTAGDVIFAKAKYSTRDTSTSSNLVTVGSTCYTPAPVVSGRSNGQILTGTWSDQQGSSPATATTVQLKLYRQASDNSFNYISTTAQYVGTNGTFSFATAMTQANFNDSSLALTATYNGCESPYSNVSKKTNGNASTVGSVTSTPTLETTSIVASSSTGRSISVKNNDANAATLYLYKNGAVIATSPSTVATTASYVFTYPNGSGTLTDGDIIYARAQVPTGTGGNAYWLSNVSNTGTVQGVSQSNAPVIVEPSSPGYYTSGSSKTITGYCDEAAGTYIYLYKNGTVVDTTTLNGYGVWTSGSLTLAAGDLLKAYADAAGKSLSNQSNQVTVLDGTASAPSAPVISTSTVVVASTTTITGTTGDGRVILYLNGEAMDSTSSSSVSGGWSIDLTVNATTSLLTRGAVLTAKNRKPSTGLYSASSNTVTVTGMTSFAVTASGGSANIGSQVAGTAFSVRITAKDAANGTGNTFNSYTGANTLTGTYAVTSGSSTSSFTSGQLDPHSVTLTTAGTYTLTTVSNNDPTSMGVSNSFVVSPNVSNKLKVNTQPSSQNNTATQFSVQPVVYLTDTYYNLRNADNTGTITASLATNANNAVLSGTLIQNISGGIVNFSDLKIDKPGQYVLKFKSSAIADSVYSDTLYVGRVWKGSSSNDFNTSGNWSNTTIPSTNDDIAFAASPTNDLYMDQDRTITNYYNYSSKKLIVNGKKLTIKGTINHSSASINASATSSEVEFAGSTGAQSIAANTFVGDSAYKININNSNGVSLGGTLKINGELKPSAGVFTTNGNLTLRSYSVTNTAVVSQGSSSGGYISGNVTVERYFPPRRAYRLITSPVTTTTSINANWQEGAVNTAAGYSNNNNPVPGYGTHITGPQGSANGLDVTQSMNSSLFVWDNNSQSWSAITNTLSTTISAGSCYRLMIRGDRSIDYSTNTPTPTYTILRTTGTLAQGDQNTVSLNGTANAWNIIGNPFQSQVDMSAVTKTNLNNFYYVWDPQMGTRGAFVNYNFTTGTNNASSAVNKYIQPGQSVFMQTAASSTASVKFNEANKNNSTTFSTVYRGTMIVPKLYASLYYTDSLATGAKAADGLAIAFDPSFSLGYQDDVSKLGNLDENFSIDHGGQQYAMELRPVPMVNDTFQFNITQYTAQRYTIRLEWDNNLAGTSVQPYLIDTYSGQEYPVNLNGITDVAYTVDATNAATKNAKRFLLVFRSTAVLPLDNITINAVQQQDMVNVFWSIATPQQVQSYEVQRSGDGRTFTTIAVVAAGAATPYTYADRSFLTGKNYYRVKAIGNGLQRLSGIVLVNTAIKGISSISITPNPVTGNTMQLQLNGLEKGYYTISIFDNNGKKLLIQQLQHNGGAGLYPVQLPSTLTSGIYQLQITGSNFNKVLTVKYN